jgi:hypothetical protein
MGCVGGVPSGAVGCGIGDGSGDGVGFGSGGWGSTFDRCSMGVTSTRPLYIFDVRRAPCSADGTKYRRAPIN